MTPAEPKPTEPPEHDPVDPEPDPPTVEVPRRSWLRRFVPIAAVLGVVLILSPAMERWPSSHSLEVALDSPATVVGVSLTVSRDEPVHATTWSFAAGEAPARLHTTVRGPDGLYDVLVDVTRIDGESRSRRHALELDGERRVTLHAN